MWKAVELEMRETTSVLNTLTLAKERLERENCALHVEAVALRKELYQCREDKALLNGIATELAVDLKEVQIELEE